MSIKKGFNRRDFLKVVGAGTGLAATGCAKDVPEKLIPYVVQPEEIIPGNSTWYTGTCNECSAGCGVLVRTREGRALKVEGNPKHPVNRGGLCALGQSSVQALYDPDRIREPLRRGISEAFKPTTWQDAIDTVADEIATSESAGKKTVFIGKPIGGSEKKIFDQYLSKFKNVDFYEYDLFSTEPLINAAESVFGKGARVKYSFDQADVIVGFGADYLETWGSPVKYAKDFSARRVPEKAAAKKTTNLLSKVFHIEPRLSLTAANADYWYKNAPGTDIDVLKAVLKLVTEKKSVHGNVKASVDYFLQDVAIDDVAKKSGITKEKIEKIANDLLSAPSSLVVAGGASVSQVATAATAITLLINSVLGNVGKSVLLTKSDSEKTKVLTPANINSLITELNEKVVSNVVFIDTNPIFTLPLASGFEAALAKAKFIVSMSKSNDETAALANIILPLSTSFESWSDSEPEPGVFAINQPAMQPLYKTQGFGDIILSLDTSKKNPVGNQFKGITDFKVYLDSEWKKRLGEDKFNSSWDEIISNGGDWTSKTNNSFGQNVSDTASLKALADSVRSVTKELGKLTFMAFPTVHFHDGRGANRSWMQEIPDPMTTSVWGSWIEIHPDLAEKFSIKHGDVVQVKTKQGGIEAPAYLTKHIHPSLVAAPIGLGHVGYGRYASGVGSNALAALDFSDVGDQISFFAADIRLQPSVAKDKLVTLQFSDTELGRGFVRGITAHDYAESLSGNSSDHAHADHGGGHHNPLALGPREEPKQMYKQMEHPVYRWGMSIDLSACTGCSACVAACYAENNIPVVGKQVCDQGREMSWIKIARFLDGPDEHPVTGFAPSLCQHCGNAPCEPVCPVYGTYHSEEGLNTMVYNRCVGTRYCSNNCSYKVRRFNWFDFEWPEPLNWQLNPDVTVRGVGVMEKCSFCIQRIREGQNDAKDEGRLVADGEIMPACASSCPTDAIKFGNLLDESSVVASDAKSNRGYKILDFELNTQPAITYLAKVSHEEINANRHLDAKTEEANSHLAERKEKTDTSVSRGH